MTPEQAKSVEIQDHRLWKGLRGKRMPLSFDLEITARCNNDCRHCCINVPVDDKAAEAGELSPAVISRIADEAVSLGAFWCLVTGGEPLLRDDFPEIYLALKRKGLLVSVFTNATLIREDHIRLFREYPPRDIEVSVYGVTRSTYERVTRRTGSFDAFTRGLNLLSAGGIKARLKAVAMRSNLSELPAIERFCRERTRDYFRMDPFLHLRFDGNGSRNADIQAERLTPEEIVSIERADRERSDALRRSADGSILPETVRGSHGHLFHCGIGQGSFSVSFDGFFRLCSDLWKTDCLYDLKEGTLAEAWLDFAPRIQDLRSHRREFLEKCAACPIIDLCFWCPARAHLETGETDRHVDYFCRVAHARAKAFGTEGNRPY